MTRKAAILFLVATGSIAGCAVGGGGAVGTGEEGVRADVRDAGAGDGPGAEIRAGGPDVPAPPDFVHGEVSDSATAGADGVSTELPAVTPISISAVEPSRGPVEGMVTVTLAGTGFVEGTEVWFGESKALYPFVISDSVMNCTAPPHGSGVVPVRAVRPDGEAAVLAGAFTYESALTLASISPVSGPDGGGTPVTVRGTGFSSNPVFLIGGRVAVAARVVDDATALMISPPGTPGKASVLAVSGAMRARLADAFEYVHTEAPPVVPGLEVHDVTPRSGPPAGGTQVAVHGSGFAPGAVVRVGPLPASSVEVVGPGEIRAVTPPGSPGPADVTVEQAGGAAALARGFEYDPGGTRVLAVEPDSGSWAGGAWVRVYGWGLDGTGAVFFGAEEAVEKEVVSPVLLLARTPRTDATGQVAVTVFADETAMGDAAFSYFDPRLSGGGTWGGPIRGALNVTVLNGMNGKPLPGAFVIVGNDPHTPFQGRTDERGQVTLSTREGLRGPVTVHGTREGFSAYTVAGFDAANVTFYISPEPSPEDPGKPPPGAYGDCTVRGRIRDFGKYLLKPPGVQGDVEVRCAASSPSMFGSGGTAGPKATADAHGRFEVVGRTGEFAVVCSLVEVGGASWWPTPLRMGIRRHVSCAKAGDVIEGVEVALTMETDGELFVNPGPAPEWPDGVNGPHVTGGWELGSDGYLSTLQTSVPAGKRLLFRGQPRDFSGEFEGQGYSFHATVSAALTSNGMPYGVTMTTRRPAPVSAPVLVGSPSGFSIVRTSLRHEVTAMRAVDGGVLAADSQGRTYWFNGHDFYLGQIKAPSPIRALWGDSLTDFWAAGDGGHVWHVVGADAVEVATGVGTDLTGISGEGPDAVEVAGGPFLMRWDGTAWRFEDIPPGLDLVAVRRFQGGGVLAVGRGGTIVAGQAGGEMNVSNPVEADLVAVEGTSVSDAWVVGTGGTLLRLDGDDVVAYTVPGAPDLNGVLVLGPCHVLVYGDDGAVFEHDCKTFVDRSRPDADLDLLAGAVHEGATVLAGRHFIRLPEFLAFPVFDHPVEGGSWSGTYLSWSFPPGTEPSYQQLLLSGSDSLPFWSMTADGGVREVLLPDFAAMIGYTPVPDGMKRVNLTASRVPGFDIDGYTSSDMNYYLRESFSVGLATFDLP